MQYVISLCILCPMSFTKVEGQSSSESQTFQDCDVCPVMTHVPAGSVSIGSYPEEISGRELVRYRDGAHYKYFMSGFRVAANMN